MLLREINVNSNVIQNVKAPIDGMNVQGLCVTLCTPVCVHVCGGQRTTQGLFLSCSLFCIFERDSLTELEASSLG